jgi:hypothetical protein
MSHNPMVRKRRLLTQFGMIPMRGFYETLFATSRNAWLQRLTLHHPLAMVNPLHCRFCTTATLLTEVNAPISMPLGLFVLAMHLQRRTSHNSLLDTQQPNFPFEKLKLVISNVQTKRSKSMLKVTQIVSQRPGYLALDIKAKPQEP